MQQNTLFKDINVGLVHDWLPTVAGGERVVAEIARMFDHGAIYTLFDFLSEDERKDVANTLPVHVSSLNSLPGIQKYYRYLLLNCTRAIEKFDVTHHDVVVSSSAALAKGVLTSPEQAHVAYVHSPARYAWDLTFEYINGIDGIAAVLKRHLAHSMMHKFRMWDMRTVPQVDQFVANSEFIRKRIWKTYRRDAQVIYPPVDTAAFQLGQEGREDYYFTASRMVPYKQVPMIAKAFSERPNLKLVIAGDGPEMARVRAQAGPNVEILGHVSFDDLRRHMQKARAFVFAAKEDFGIVPVEAQACGCPVIALGAGGTAETVRDISMEKPTGVWFDEQTPEALLKAIDTVEAEHGVFTEQNCRDNALYFSADRFRSELSTCIVNTMQQVGRVGS
ncbi:glycosyltransferase [Maritalea sp.]|uniref:glycosyltransferase n=1 Tax=Maritalea sp. TaxID=2003361 RepID=UPI003EF36601